MSDLIGMNRPSKVRAPRVNDETHYFWAATAGGKLLVKHCNSCGENHFYPRTFCPFCFSDDTEYLETAGPTMMTNLIDCDFDKLEIGQAVKVAFIDTGEATALPFFAPA